MAEALWNKRSPSCVWVNFVGGGLFCKKNMVFFLAGIVRRMKQAIEPIILSRIYGNGRGWVFSQADFADLGPRPTIDSALHRRESEGVIRRVMRGIYDYPRHSRALHGPVSPDIDQVAHALARKFGWRIQPDGATAQNLLGLSTQVPARQSISPAARIAPTRLERRPSTSNTRS